MAGYQAFEKQLRPPAFVVDTELLKSEKHIHLSPGEQFHMVHVKRLGPGSVVSLVDGLGNIAPARVLQMDTKEVILERTGPIKWQDDLLPMKLILAMIKGERMDLAISKLSEIGVGQIQPVITSRTVTRLSGERLKKKWQRWQALSLHSLKQCRGAMATKVLKPLQLGQALLKTDTPGSRIVLLEDQGKSRLLETLQKTSMPFPLTIAIGPEGGFSPEEKRLLVHEGFQPASLGTRILRSETAAIFSASIVSEFYTSGDTV